MPTEKVKVCQVCHTQTEVKGPADEKSGCAFCDAPPSAQTIVSEAAS